MQQAVHERRRDGSNACACVEDDVVPGVLLRWITDHVQDCITHTAARYITTPQLRTATTDAEASGDFFAAAVRRLLLAWRIKMMDGDRGPPSVQCRLNALDALGKTPTDAMGNDIRKLFFTAVGANA